MTTETERELSPLEKAFVGAKHAVEYYLTISYDGYSAPGHGRHGVARTTARATINILEGEVQKHAKLCEQLKSLIADFQKRSEAAGNHSRIRMDASYEMGEESAWGSAAHYLQLALQEMETGHAG